METAIEDICNEMRLELKCLEDRARRMMDHGRFDGEQSFGNQHGEMKAQIMLTVRHLEGARMRVGKVLQYADDGVSILDK